MEEAEVLKKKGFVVRNLPFNEYLEMTEQQKITKVDMIVTIDGATEGSYADKVSVKMKRAKALSHKKYREKARKLCHISRIEWNDASLVEEIAELEKMVQEEMKNYIIAV